EAEGVIKSGAWEAYSKAEVDWVDSGFPLINILSAEKFALPVHTIVTTSDGFVAGFARADAQGGDQIVDKNFAIADLTCLGRLHDRAQGFLHEIVGDDDLDFDLGDKIDGVFGATVHFDVAFLSAEAANFGDGHAENTLFGQGSFNIFEFEMSDNCFDFFH